MQICGLQGYKLEYAAKQKSFWLVTRFGLRGLQRVTGYKKADERSKIRPARSAALTRASPNAFRLCALVEVFEGFSRPKRDTRAEVNPGVDPRAECDGSGKLNPEHL